LWHRWYNGGWFGWESLGGVLTSNPAAASMTMGRLDVFARGGDRALWHRWYDANGWGNWESLGGILASGPAVSTWGTGRLDVFIHHEVATTARHAFGGRCAHAHRDRDVGDCAQGIGRKARRCQTAPLIPVTDPSRHLVGEPVRCHAIADGRWNWRRWRIRDNLSQPRRDRFGRSPGRLGATCK